MATLKELAQLVGGEMVGADGEIRALGPIDRAGAGEITFLANPKYLPLLAQTKAAVLVGRNVAVPPGVSHIICDNPYLAFAKVLTHLHARRPAPCGVMPGAHIAPSALLGDEVTVYPGVVVGDNVRLGRGTCLYPGVILYADVVVGDDCILHGGVVVREGCRLGHRVIVQPNAVIGGDGFGFAPDGDQYFKIPQIGIVVIDDDVEIGAATCIDRAALGVTRVGRGSKLDNLVQIAHNVVVGEATVMAAQAGIAGSTQVGRHCTFGGQSAVAGHLKVGDNLTFGGRAGVTGNIEGGATPQILSGMPPIPHKDWLKTSLCVNKLPEMRKELNRLHRQLAELELLIKEKLQ